MVFLKDTRVADMVVDFREPGKQVAGVERHSLVGGAGRPHREEAMMIQHGGVENDVECNKCAANHGAFTSCKSVQGVHHGACGCCVWDSKAMECSHALETLRKELEHKEAINDLKQRKRKVSKPVLSKAKRGSKRSNRV